MRERALAAVQARLKSFADTQDPDLVLDPAALIQVGALLDAVPDPGADPEAAYAAGLVHWCRYMVLDPDDDQPDLVVALTLLEPLYRAQPEALPDPVRRVFDDDETRFPARQDLAAVRATQLLQDALRTR